MERTTTELHFHDRQARDRAATFRAKPDQYRFDEAAYLDHETWIRPAFEQLGDVHGLRVLDYGCGHGMASVVLARGGARVVAFDLSPGYLEEARNRAAANGQPVVFIQADGHRLPFADESFDRVWGNAILHHLDLRVAGPEVYRILRPGGLAVFCEPWGGNPVLRWARGHLSYPGKDRTPEEEPLRQTHVELLQALFDRVEARGFQLLSMARRVVRMRRLVAGLDWCDAMLLGRVPALEHFCRYVVLTLHRRGI